MWTDGIPPGTVEKVGALVAGDSGAMAALIADPHGFAKQRLGLDLPAGFLVRQEGSDMVFGVGDDLRRAPLDELPDDVLDAVAGGTSSDASKYG